MIIAHKKIHQVTMNDSLITSWTQTWKRKRRRRRINYQDSQSLIQNTLLLLMILLNLIHPQVSAVTMIHTATSSSYHVLNQEANKKEWKESNHGPTTNINMIQMPSSVRVEFPGHTIGDNYRSESSSASFFQSVDSDGDGTIGKSELSKFLEQQIGGSAFDEVAEIEKEVGSMMKKMDLNEDGSLDYNKDVLTHWMSLEALLTVDEVAEWVVHAVQLPEEVGSLFRQHYVTGSDFPELVDNEGIALKDEVGITKESYRKKIMRLVRAKMLGIGSPPEQVQVEEIDVESCSTIRLKWNKPDASGFPVHKYRIMRRQRGGANTEDDNNYSLSSTLASVNHGKAMTSEGTCAKRDGLKEGHGNNFYQQFRNALIKAPDHVIASEESCGVVNPVCPIVTTHVSSSGWRTVYDGSELEFIDTGLKPGEGYIYRIQAWNGAGKSMWTVVDTSEEWKNRGCDKKETRKRRMSRALPNETTDLLIDSEIESKSKHTLLSILYMFFMTVSSWSKVILNVVLTLLAVNTAIMKIRRASLHSTASKLDPVFPWLWEGMNSMFRLITGHDIITFFTTHQHQASKNHDVAVKSVGLNGYKESPGMKKQLSRNISDPTKRPVHVPDNTRRTQSERILIKSPSLEHMNGKVTKDADTRKETARSLSREKSNLFIRGKSSKSPRAKKKDIALQQPDVSSTLEPSDVVPENQTAFNDEGIMSDNVKRRMNPRFKFRSWKKDSKMTVSPTESERSISHSMEVDPTDAIKIDESSHSCSQNNQDEDESTQSSIIYDHNLCNCCGKSFKFPKRCRHNCARCGSAFCHKHGKTTHPNFISCKVPGDCICNRCLMK